MHLSELLLLAEDFPSRQHYPFSLEVLNKTKKIFFNTPVTFFIGENGSGKSTLLRAIAQRCGIHIWEAEKRTRQTESRYADDLYRYMDIVWTEGKVPGSFFSSESFQQFAWHIDEWARADPGMLNYFGGEKYTTKSHGQYHMAFFKSRYRIKGLYLLDEPENALSPKRQLELLNILFSMSREGHAQFVIATHSPILLALPGASIYSFDHIPIQEIGYEDTDYYRIYRDFLNDRKKYLTTAT